MTVFSSQTQPAVAWSACKEEEGRVCGQVRADAPCQPQASSICSWLTPCLSGQTLTQLWRKRRWQRFTSNPIAFLPLLPSEAIFCSALATVQVHCIFGTTQDPIGGFIVGRGVRQGYILSPGLFNLHAEYIMRNAGLEEAQAGIKIARRNINNHRYADNNHSNGRKVKRN